MAFRGTPRGGRGGGFGGRGGFTPRGGRGGMGASFGPPDTVIGMPCDRIVRCLR
ncbi:hypothetical protein A1F99_100590 [Pyrenophora tritici-repentis]|nr:hypothetical protein A1F99_100590 [Pyrenophora tritici-repentis]